MKGDTFVVNHFVSKTSKEYMLPSDEVVSFQFQRLVTVSEGDKRYARCSFNGNHKTMMEIIEKYGLNTQGRWQVWDKEKKQNIGFQGEL